VSAAIVIGIGIYLPLTLLAPLPSTVAELAFEQPTTPPPASYALPADGISAFGLQDGTGLIAGQGADQSYPMASITKIVTALVVLEKYPLGEGEPGPSVRMGRVDLAFYEDYYLRGAKLLHVLEGWTFTERELLEIVLVDSAANYASSLSHWAFGSNANYTTAARRWLDAHGLADITVVEPVGLDARNTATPAALVDLGRIALANPLVAELVGTRSLPMHDIGGLENTNELLGSDGITGIKTGTLEGYGASLLFSTTLSIEGGTLPLVGAVLGAWDHSLLGNEVHGLLASVQNNYHRLPLVHRYDVFGSYSTPWGDTAEVIAANGADLVVWGDQAVELQVAVDDVTTASDGDRVGEAVFTSGDETIRVPLLVRGAIEDPGFWWRVGHPGQL
jgi:D-alanyl-D-alanine carboxypeptidase (penicillin-binding protein 5/6)